MIIFLLVVASLGFGYLPAAHPGWSAATTWATAFIAGVLFFVSVLLHEMSHALVGRAMGIEVRRITLFLFGGLAHMESEPRTPGSELAMTIAGPLTSLGLGFVFTLIGVTMAGPQFQELATADPQAAMAAIGPVTSLFLWLGPVNFILGIFNLIPGFPLDGGRVLRAGLWAATGDLRKATRWATGVGRGFGWMLMAIGVLMAFGLYIPFLGGGLIGGLWLVLIGWFLSNAARASYEQLVVRDTLTGVPVTTLMKRDFDSVPGDLPVSRFVEEHVMRTDQRSFPVTSGGPGIDGLVCIEDVRRVPKDRWEMVRVQDIMTPSEELTTLSEEDDANRALETLGKRQVDQLPVLKDGTLVGLIRRKDIIRWLTLHTQTPAEA